MKLYWLPCFYVIDECSCNWWLFCSKLLYITNMWLVFFTDHLDLLVNISRINLLTMLPLKTKTNRLIPNQESHTDSFRCISLACNGTKWEHESDHHLQLTAHDFRIIHVTVMLLRDYSKIPRNFELNTDGTCWSRAKKKIRLCSPAEDRPIFPVRTNFT